MAKETVVERVSVLETKVEHINEKIDNLKEDVKEMHDCLDRTRDLLDGKLDTMLTEYRDNRDKFYDHANYLNEIQTSQHNELAEKISELERFKNKWMYIGIGVIAALGWLGHVDPSKIFSMFGG